MSTDIRQVTTSVHVAVEELKKKAEATKAKLDANLAEANEAIDMAGSFADEIGAASRELRDILGVKTNSPPQDG